MCKYADVLMCKYGDVQICECADKVLVIIKTI